MSLVGEPRLEEILFFLGIPKFGRLWAKRKVIYDYEGREASIAIGEADMLFGVDVGGGLHLMLCFVEWFLKYCIVSSWLT